MQIALALEKTNFRFLYKLHEVFCICTCCLCLSVSAFLRCAVGPLLYNALTTLVLQVAERNDDGQMADFVEAMMDEQVSIHPQAPA